MFTQRFDTVSEYLEYIQTPTDMPDSDRASIQYQDSWSGGLTNAQAVNMAIHGWPEGIEKVEKFTSKLNTVLTGRIKIPEIQYDVTGQCLDIGRFVNGEPEDFMSIVDSAIQVNATPPKIIRVVCNLVASAAVDADALIMRGAAVAAFVDIMEKHGTRIELDIVSSISNISEVWVRVKDYDYPLNLSNLVFQLAHPSSFRKLVFCWLEHMPREIRRQQGVVRHGGYGSCVEASEHGDVYAGMMRGIYTEAMALQWVTEQLEKQGIEVEHED